MTLDIVYIGDGIVNHQAQRQDKGKKGNAIDGIAEEIIAKQRQAEAEGHRHRHHQGLPPSQGKGEQSDDGDDGKKQ